MTREEALRRVQEIRETPEFWDRSRDLGKNTRLVREMNELAPIAFAEVSEEPEARKAREEREAAAAAARAELEELRAEPAFLDAKGDPAKHGAIQKRIAELTAIVVADEAAADAT